MLLFCATITSFDMVSYNDFSADTVKDYLFPVVLAFVIFIMDTWYSLEENGSYFANDTLLYIGSFFLFVTLSIVISPIVLKWAMFSIAWIMITMMKFRTIISARVIKSDDK